MVHVRESKQRLVMRNERLVSLLARYCGIMTTPLNYSTDEVTITGQ